MKKKTEEVIIKERKRIRELAITESFITVGERKRPDRKIPYGRINTESRTMYGFIGEKVKILIFTEKEFISVFGGGGKI